MTSRFKTTLEVDREILADPALPIRKRFAVLHRMNAKEILTENINYCNILMRILARFGPDQEFKQRYMQIVEGFETEDQIMKNRIKLRRYLRELCINQKRVLQAALDKDYINKVKEYFDQKKREEEKKKAKEHQQEEDDDDNEEESEEEEEDK